MAAGRRQQSKFSCQFTWECCGLRRRSWVLLSPCLLPALHRLRRLCRLHSLSLTHTRARNTCLLISISFLYQSYISPLGKLHSNLFLFYKPIFLKIVIYNLISAKQSSVCHLHSSSPLKLSFLLP